ncbi:MAG: FHA domain-containing protein [Chitinispirillia bacterium]|jgi:hypothetical protein
MKKDLYLVHFPEQPVKVSRKKKTTIGRSNDNDIVLKEVRVSRNHAEIIWVKKTDTYTINDLDSSNGTFVNGVRLDKKNQLQLKDRDKIRIASTVFTARIVSNSSEIMLEFDKLKEDLHERITTIFKSKDYDDDQIYSGFEGTLAHFCPLELFQMLETGGKTGILQLATKNGEGRYGIARGQVVTAEYGKKKGKDAVFAIMTLNKGTFSFSPCEVDIKKPEITLNTTLLLMEWCRLMDEKSKN